MAHDEGGGGSWVATLIFSLALWGGILAITVFVGHTLALRMTGH